MMESLTNECLKNPYIWAFAIIYFFVYTVRQGVTSWFIFYLLKVSRLQIRLVLLCLDALTGFQFMQTFGYAF